MNELALFTKPDCLFVVEDFCDVAVFRCYLFEMLWVGFRFFGM
jgi:hypothetical protein